jgi:hypothetical protein
MPSEGAPIENKDVRGLKHLRRLLPLFERLRDVGCERDAAGNRQLVFDQYCTLVMLYLFNPLIDTLHCLQHASSLPKVQNLGVKRFSMGSFSEAPAVFEPQQLKAIIAELAQDARPLAVNPRLGDLKDALTLVDSTVLEALPRLARVACRQTRVHKRRDGTELHAFRLHTQLDLRTFQPQRVDRTGAANVADIRESAVLRQTLQPGRCYVHDTAYAHYNLLDQIIDIGSGFVTRVREDCAHEIIEQRTLTPQDRKAGIVCDRLVRLGGAQPMKHPVRLITVQIPPHLRRTRKADRPHGGKTDKGMRHLLSRRPQGLDIQVYCAVIACLIINLQTGKKPDKRMMETIGWYLMGLMDEQQALAELSRPDNRGIKLRAKAELWKKLGW